MSQAVLELTLLGPSRIAARGVQMALSPSVSNALAFLALGPREGRARAAMASSLFGGCSESAARRRLATTLWRLRQELRPNLGRDVVDPDGDTRVRIAPDVSLSVDALDFLRAVEPHVGRPVEDLSDADVHRLEQAVDGYGGDLLESSADEWVLAERLRLSVAYLDALDLLVQHHGERGAVEAVHRHASRLLALEPLREDYLRHAMTAYARAGRPDLVERHFETCRSTLLRELGVDPLPETVALYARLTTGPSSGTSPLLRALVADLERARREVGDLAALVERALESVRHLS